MDLENHSTLKPKIAPDSRFWAFWAVFLLPAAASIAAATTPQTPPTTVPLWGIFERAIAGPAGGNPFVDVQLSATFTLGDRTFLVHGFYDGDGQYRIRFMPDAPGSWHYSTQCNIPELSGLAGDFTCTAAQPGVHGPVRVRNVHHFAYADGAPFVCVGTTCYAWTTQPEALEEETLASLRTSPFNKVRMCLLPGKQVPNFYPYAQDAAGQFDRDRFNVDFFRHLEKRIEDLGDAGVEADLILFHPYHKGAMQWFDEMDDAFDDRYLHYVVARLSAYHNVWWSLANEYGQVKNKTDADWDHFFQLVQADDPYGHLRSIHNSAKIYDSNKPWVTHASIQNGSAVADFGRAVIARELWPKPIVYDEVCYEGNLDRRWGKLTGREMLERFWLGFIAGTYVGHGEVLSSAPGVTWTSNGGKLVGQSPPRIAFLRKILEAGPADGIEPIDETYQTHFAGKAGEYYLVYFGTEKPASWTFALPRDPPNKTALAEGMKFHADVIDTWNMTIQPIARSFVLGKLADSVYPAVDGAAIALPGKSDMAIRIARQR
jgi:hypothetical protein